MAVEWYRGALLQWITAGIAERHEHRVLSWGLILQPLRRASHHRAGWNSHCLWCHEASSCKALFMAGGTVVIPVRSTDYAVCYEYFSQSTHLMSVLVVVHSIIELCCGFRVKPKCPG